MNNNGCSGKKAMFKFVVLPPQAGCGHLHRRDADNACVKEKRSGSLLDYLNKQKDNAARANKGQDECSTEPLNREDTELRNTYPRFQYCEATTKTGFFIAKNGATLEESYCDQSFQRILTRECICIKGEPYPRQPVSSVQLHTKIRVYLEAHCRDPANVSCAKEKYSQFPRGEGVQSAKNGQRPKSAGDGAGLVRARRMTHDSYSVSDSENEAPWLDQPSPILLTSSPPRTALKVPATRATNSPFSNGFHGSTAFKHGSNSLDKNSNCLEKTKSDRTTERDVEQKACDLFHSSLKNSERLATSWQDNANFPQKRLLPQEPFSFLRSANGNFYGETDAPKSSMISISENENHSQQPGQAVSGPLFMDGPLFMTDEGCDEDYDEFAPRKGVTKDVSGTERTITTSLYPITNYDGPLCHPNGRTTFHNHTGKRWLDNSKSMREKNASYSDFSSQESVGYEGVIKIDKAETEHYGPGSKSNGLSASTAGNEAKKNRKLGSLQSSSGSKLHFRRPMSGRSRNHRRPQRLSDNEDDDDATTITMVTNSDDAEELSSFSSNSTTCESVDDAKNSTPIHRRQNMCRHPNDPNPMNDFATERVEDSLGFVNETSVCNRIDSPHYRRMSLQCSISIQSGKSRERLNATTDDEQSLYGSTPRGSTQGLEDGQHVRYGREHSGSDIEIPSPHQASPPSYKFRHAAIRQRRHEPSLNGRKTSRSLSRLPVQKRSPSRLKRSRSLEHGLQDSFSPEYSETGERRSPTDWRQRNSLGSNSEISAASSVNRRPKLRKAPSTSSLVDQYKPKIDVAESLTALLLNPVNGHENERSVLDEYLKKSWNNIRGGVAYSSEELCYGHGKYGSSQSPFCGKSGSGYTRRKDVTDKYLEPDDLEGTPTGTRSRPSQIVSKSQTPDRYPAVGASPRSICALLPSPRRENRALPEVITIIDNEVPVPEHEVVGRRNSFIEAVTGSSSENVHSCASQPSDGEDVQHAFNELAVAAEQAALTPRSSTVKNAEGQFEKTQRADANPQENTMVFHEEVGVNLSKDPVSHDLAVAVVRRPSVRSHSTSSTISLSTKPAHQDYDNRGSLRHSTPTTTHSYLSHTDEDDQFAVHHSLPRNQAMGSLSDIVTVKCRNTRCKKAMCLEDAKTKFKSCHHCYTYYCSHQCRLAHWERHKLKCVFARVNSDCKKILRMGRDDDVVRQAFTRVARTGYLSRGRGCVQVIFSCPEKAERFISEGLFALESLPLYRTVQKLRELQKRLVEDSDLITNGLIETCETEYDAEKSYVLQVLIDIPDETLAAYDRSYRHRDSHGVYIHTVNPVYKSEREPNSPKTTPNSAPETLILTPPTAIPEAWLASSPGGFRRSASSSSGSIASLSPATSSAEASRNAKRARQLCFISIQRKLREKGVTMRHQYPDVYRSLCAYVDTGATFTPAVIYPQDTRTGKNFMCLVMPGSEPQFLGWVQTPGLLDDIATG